jgi:hypothetical protein
MDETHKALKLVGGVVVVFLPFSLYLFIDLFP